MIYFILPSLLILLFLLWKSIKDYIAKDNVFDFIIITVVFALIISRLFGVIDNFDYYLSLEFSWSPFDFSEERWLFFETMPWILLNGFDSSYNILALMFAPLISIYTFEHILRLKDKYFILDKTITVFSIFYLFYLVLENFIFNNISGFEIRYIFIIGILIFLLVQSRSRRFKKKSGRASAFFYLLISILVLVNNIFSSSILSYSTLIAVGFFLISFILSISLGNDKNISKDGSEQIIDDEMRIRRNLSKISFMKSIRKDGVLGKDISNE